MGVVVRRYIDILTIIINFPYSTCISSFLAAVYIHTHCYYRRSENFRVLFFSRDKFPHV